MSSRLFKFAVIAIAIAVLVYPLVESMDTWDGFGPTNDTELNVVGLVVAIGFILALRQLIVLTTAAKESIALRLDAPDDPDPVTPPSGLTAFSSSGPPPLLPLRI